MTRIFDDYSYGLQLQPGGEALTVAEMAASAHAMLILDPADVTAADVSALQAAGKTVLLRVEAATTSTARDWWDAAWTVGGDDADPLAPGAPGWISDHIVQATGDDARLVDYWQADWAAIARAQIDHAIADLGADGVYLQGVGDYAAWAAADGGQSLQTYAQRMIDLVADLSAHAQSLDAEALILAGDAADLPGDADDAGAAQDFLDAISALLQTGVFFENGLQRDDASVEASLAVLRDAFQAAGLPVLNLEPELTAPDAVAAYTYMLSAENGLIGYADRADGLLAALQPTQTEGTGGRDTIYVTQGRASVDAGAGGDWVYNYSDGAEIRLGGADNDHLINQAGAVTAVYDGDAADLVASYSVSFTSGMWELRFQNGSMDSFWNVDRFQFDDGVYTGDQLSALIGPNGYIGGLQVSGQGGPQLTADVSLVADAGLPPFPVHVRTPR